MSATNFTLKVLEIKDENISVSERIDSVVKKGIRHTVIFAKLSYNPDACPVCGTINENYSIIKNGTKTSNIKILPINGDPAFLRVQKQRFLCKSCGHSFSAESDIIDRCFGCFKPAKNRLPEHLMFDEFKSVKNVSGSMSFIYADAENHQIVDIVEDRRLFLLKRYFRRFTPAARQSVKTICMDMYSPYISLVRELFPNAAIIFDRFHIVQLLFRALIKTRIDEMATHNTNAMEYKRLKRYWKLIQKDSSALNRAKFHHYTHFKYFVSEQTVVNESIAVSPVLTATYNAYQLLLSDLRNRRSDLMIVHLKAFLAEKGTLSEPMVKSIRTLLSYQEETTNALKYNYSNGPIEGINNYIKVLKRIAFGYRSFVRMRNRILITHNLLKTKTEYRAA